ncbi:MAG: SdrD B-like domain-containing protein, partial [Dolichospermum sp.]
NDYNNDGVHQASETQGQAGITVKVTDKNGVVHTTVTDAEGKWKLNIPPADYCVRVEYSNLPSNIRSSSTVAGNTTTQFYNTPTCSADMGVLNLTDYSQSNPDAYVPLWHNGDPSDPSLANRFSIAKFSYSTTGAPIGGGSVTTSGVIPVSTGGTLWGEAWDKYNKKLYASAVLRRHAGLGVEGLSGLYMYNPSTGTTTTYNLATITGLNFGTVASNSSRGLTSMSNPSWDIDAYDKVGKVGIGGISLSEDGSKLYVMNLFLKKIVVMNIPAMTFDKTIDVPDPGCIGGNYRPWSVKYYKGSLFVGVVCDAQTSQNKSNLTANIYKINPLTGSFTQILDFPLTYPKGIPNNGTASGWFPWSDDYNDFVNSSNASGGGQNGGYPTPVLADLDFDIDGAMVIALNDRSASQYGYYNYLPDPTFSNTSFWAANVGGDILRAFYSNGVYALENGGVSGANVGANVGNNEGPGFGEFFNDNFISSHSEALSGGIAIKPGSGEVGAVFMDPDNTSGAIFSGGVKYMYNSNGQYNRAYNIYTNSNGLETFGKSNGLGDLEFAYDVPNFSQIGNRVWQDTDGDGIQDPCEPGIAGITM